MPHPLDGAERKFNRADRHLSEADDLVRAWSKSCENNVFSDDDYKTINFGKWPDAPLDLSLVISDAVHNLRGALDYLVYELAILDSGKVQDGTQFLIEDVKADPINRHRGFDPRSKKYLKGLTQTHINAIASLQPYNGVEWTKTLRDISNPDKHRTLIALTHEGRPAGVRIIHGPDGRFPGQPYVTTDGVPTFDHFDVEFDGNHAVAITLSDGSEHAVMPTLRRIQAEVCRTLGDFKAEFK